MGRTRGGTWPAEAGGSRDQRLGLSLHSSFPPERPLYLSEETWAPNASPVSQVGFDYCINEISPWVQQWGNRVRTEQETAGGGDLEGTNQYIETELHLLFIVSWSMLAQKSKLKY